VQVEHQVVPGRAKPARQVEIGRQPPACVGSAGHDHLVEVRVSRDDWRGVRFDQVGEAGARHLPPKRAKDWRREDDVADQAQADQENSHGLVFDLRLVEQHDRNVVVADRVDATALRAFQAGTLVDRLNGHMALGAHEDIEKFGIDGHGSLLGCLRELYQKARPLSVPTRFMEQSIE
jgi:demethoxyubiquinone hydroxylase (CLK1/Coq7/Cat5 family)